MNPWKVLGVQRGAPIEVVQAAHKALAKTWHPDKHMGQPTEAKAKQRMAEVNQALQTIVRGEARRSSLADDVKEAVELGELVGDAGVAVLNFVKKLRGK